MSSVINLIPHATLQASTFDNTGPCFDQRCNPSKLAIDGSMVYWQSVADKDCSNQWLYADWSQFGAFDISDFAIDYGTLGHTFDGTLISLRFSSISTHLGELLSENSSTSYSVLDYTSCQSTADNSVAKQFFGEGRVDRCFWKDGTPAGALTNITGALFTWSLSIPKEFPDAICQMNVNEVDVFGVASSGVSGKALSTANGAVSGNTVRISNNNVVPTAPAQPESTPTTTPSSGISLGAIAGVVFVCALVAFGVGVLVVRKRNLEKRRRAHRLLATSLDDWGIDR
ncbi:UNVERIFIED_CONTAM: hypothetical protein HDU68_001613 [Siphonaria sp. JEL0065]|nr:hypothetical protein HDU68_001613 [Siphonaria sp. JEL0065]